MYDQTISVKHLEYIIYFVMYGGLIRYQSLRGWSMDNTSRKKTNCRGHSEEKNGKKNAKCKNYEKKMCKGLAGKIWEKTN